MSTALVDDWIVPEEVDDWVVPAESGPLGARTPNPTMRRAQPIPEFGTEPLDPRRIATEADYGIPAGPSAQDFADAAVREDIADRIAETPDDVLGPQAPIALPRARYEDAVQRLGFVPTPADLMRVQQEEASAAFTQDQAKSPTGAVGPRTYAEMQPGERAGQQWASSVEALRQNFTGTAMASAFRNLRELEAADRGEQHVGSSNIPGERIRSVYEDMAPEQRAAARARLQDRVARGTVAWLESQARQGGLAQHPAVEHIIKAGNEGRWGDVIRMLAADPLGLLQEAVVSSAAPTLAMMVPGVAVGAAGVGRIGTGVVSYFSSYGTEFGGQFLEAVSDFLKASGVDTRDPQAVRNALMSNPQAVNDAIAEAARGANGPAIFDALSMGFARGFVPGAGVARNAGRIGANFLSGGAEEAAGGAAGQVFARGSVDKPGELIMEALGGFGQGAPLTAVGTIQEMREAQRAAPPPLNTGRASLEATLGGTPTPPAPPPAPPAPSPSPPAVPVPAAAAGTPPPPSVAAPAPGSSPVAGAPTGAADQPSTTPAPAGAPVSDTPTSGAAGPAGGAAAPTVPGPGPAATPPSPAAAALPPIAPAPPPPPVNTGRTSLEDTLAGNSPAEVAARRAETVQRWQAALPQGFTVEDDGEFFAVYDPAGQYIVTSDNPSAETIAESVAEVEARLKQGLYPELTAAAQPFGQADQVAAAQQLAQQERERLAAERAAAEEAERQRREAEAFQKAAQEEADRARQAQEREAAEDAAARTEQGKAKLRDALAAGTSFGVQTQGDGSVFAMPGFDFSEAVRLELTPQERRAHRHALAQQELADTAEERRAGLQAEQDALRAAVARAVGAAASQPPAPDVTTPPPAPSGNNAVAAPNVTTPAPDVTQEPSELVQAMNLLAELEAELDAQGMVKDARLADRVRDLRERVRTLKKPPSSDPKIAEIERVLFGEVGKLISQSIKDLHGKGVAADDLGKRLGNYWTPEKARIAFDLLGLTPPKPKEPEPSAAPPAPPQGEGAQGQAPEATKPADDLDDVFDQMADEEDAKAGVKPKPRVTGTTRGGSQIVAPQPRPAPDTRPTPQVAASAATKAGSGVAEAAAALEALMMGKQGKLYSGLPVFDPETYKVVLPQLRKAVQDFRDAWGDVKELMRRAYQGLVAAVTAENRERFREWIKPYITRFTRDVQAGDVRLEEADDGLEGGSDGDAGAGQPPASGGTASEGDAGEEAGGTGGGGGRPVLGDGGKDAQGAPAGEGDVRGAEPDGSPGDRGSETDGDRGDNRPAGEGGSGSVAEAVQDATPKATGTNYVITDADKIGEGSERQKARDNVEAIRLLKAIEAEKRQATTEEKAVLVRYVGWGGLKRAFKPAGAPQWMQQTNKDLRELLTAEEYDLAEGSVLNAHYTSPEVVRGMWEAVRHMGFTGGRALEPSAGVGHFLGMAPQDFARPLRWTAGELDSVTGRILGLLYPEAAVNVGPFETARLPDGFYDLAISNVPFGDYPANDPSPRYARARRSIHDYFFARSLDLVRPGGVVAFITSRFTLDKIVDGSRKLYAEKGTFLGAIRLPDTAFKGNAGTEVVTDVIFMRRLLPDEKPDTTGEWMRTAEIRTPEGPATINAWFAARPEMMLGEMRLTGTMYGPAQPTLKPREDAPLAEQFAAAVRSLPTDAFRTAPPSAPAAATASLEAAVGERDGAYGLDDKGGVYAVVNGRRKPVTGREAGLARSYMGVRDTLRAVIAAEQRGVDDVTLDPLRKALNESYDAFSKAYGPLNSTVVRKSPNGKPYKSMVNLRPLASDPDIWRVAAVEDYDFETGKATKRAVFRERILAPAKRVDVANTPGDAIALSLDRFGRFDLAFAAQTLGMDEQQTIEAMGDMIFQNPAGEQWETAVEYLSGDVRKKLAQAEAAARLDPEYERNVKALRPKIPPTLTASADALANEIQAPFGAPWVPPAIYMQFLNHLADRTVPKGSRIEWSRAGAGWIVDLTFNEGGIPALERWSTGRVSFKYMLQQTLNNGRVVVKDSVPDGKGGHMEVVNQKETEAAQGVQRNLRAEFENWVYLDEGRRSSLQDLYNEKYNNLAPRDWRSQADILSFPGIATRIVRGNETLPFALRPHQKAAIWRIVASGNTLLGHAVGAGKTFTMIGAGMEMKRLGMVRKPLFVVPNHMLGQFRREFYELYPGADLLIATKDDVSRRGRQSFIGRAASSNPDAIIMTHSSFGRLPMRQEAYAEFVREELDAAREALAEAEREEGKKSASVRLIRKRLKALEARLTKLLQADKKDTGATFEETGIDFLFIDEAHEFKNLPISTKMGSVRGLSTTASGKAIDLFTKIRLLDKRTPNRAAVFATGTPVSNTMAEVYTMQRYLQPRTLEEQGIESFDGWAATFGEIVTSLEVRPSGNGFKESARFSRFRNAPELTAMFSTVSDVQTAEMLNLPRPELRGGKPRTIALDPTPWQQDKAAELAGRYENLPPDPTIDNALKIVTEGRKAALDPRLLDENAGERSGGKIEAIADEILRIYEEGNQPLREAGKPMGHGYFGVPMYGPPGKMVENHGKLQIVFCDLGTPNNRKRAAAPVSADGMVRDEDGNIIIDGEADDVTNSLAAPEDGDDADGADDAAGPDAEVMEAEKAEAEQNALADDTGFNVYKALTDRLVRMGIPRDEIAWIHDAKNDAQKDEMFTAAREGRIRVLMGSTAKMGVGTNVQRLAIALHHGDAPWRPSDVEQREGRLRRQGNLNPEVEIIRYVTTGTFDAYMWQTLEAKARFIGQFLAGTKGKRNVEDIDTPLPDAATVKAIATGDNRILEVAELNREIAQMSAAREQHARTQEIARSVLRSSPPKIESMTTTLAALKADAEGLKAAKWKDRSGQTFAKAEDAMKAHGAAMATAMQDAMLRRGERVRFGASPGDPAIVSLPLQFGAFEVQVATETSVFTGFLPDATDRKGPKIEYFRGDFQPRVVGEQTYLAGREFYALMRMDTRELVGDGTFNPLQITARVEALARGIDGLIADTQRRIADLERDIATAEKDAARPFAKEEEYRTKLARLRTLEAELTGPPPGAQAPPAVPPPAPPGTIRVEADDDSGGATLSHKVDELPRPGRRSLLRAGAGFAIWMVAGKSYSQTVDAEAAMLRGDLKGALEAVQASSGNVQYRELARRLLPLIEGIRLRVIEVGKDYPEGFPRDLESAYGVTDVNLNTGAATIFLRHQPNTPEFSGTTDETLLHEALHAVLVSRYGRISRRIVVAASGRAETPLAGDEHILRINALWDEMSKMVHRNPAMRRHALANSWLRAPVENPDEFISYALTSPKFQDWMKEQRLNTEGLWKRFVRAVGGFLGFGARYPTFLETVADATYSLLTEAEKVAPGSGNARNRLRADAGTDVEDSAIFAQEAATIERLPEVEEAAPERTVTAYKLFRRGADGALYPLFIGAKKPVPVGRWIAAEHIPTKGFAERPGWHAGVLPTAPHLRTKQNRRAADRVWAEVEMPADRDWQADADASRTRDIRDRVPEGGFYRFRTNKMQGGAWLIGGALKVNKVLSDADVRGVLQAAGETEEDIAAEAGAYDADAPPLYSSPFDPAAFDRFIWRPLKDMLGGTTALTSVKWLTNMLEKAGFKPVTGVKVDVEKQADRYAWLHTWRLMPILNTFLLPPAVVKGTPLEGFQRDAARRMQEMDNYQMRLDKDFEEAQKAIKKGGGKIENVEAAVWLADARAIENDDKAAYAEMFDELGLNEAERKGYEAVRRLYDKQGRLIDNHKRDMMQWARKRTTDIARTMNRIMESASVDTDAYRKLTGRRAYLKSKLRDGRGDPVEVNGKLAVVEKAMRDMREADPDIAEKMAKLQEQYDAAEAKLAESSIRERRQSYAGHKFFGGWRLFTVEGVNPETGEKILKEINSADGFWGTEQAAMRAAKAHLETNPDAEFVIRKKAIMFPGPPGAAVSDAQFHRVMNEMEKRTEMDHAEVRDMMAGVIKKRARRRVAVFQLRRGDDENPQGHQGFVRDLTKAMRAHTAQVTRYVALDRLKYELVTLQEDLGLSPANNSAGKDPRVKEAIRWLDAFWRDVTGGKQPLEAALDTWLSKWPIASPVTAAAAALLAIGPASPVIAIPAAAYVGIRMGRAIAKGGDFPMRSTTDRYVSDQAQLKLGMLFNIASPMVNLLQVAQTVWPFLKEKYTKVGIEHAVNAFAVGVPFFRAAMSDTTRERAERDRRLLERANIETSFGFADWSPSHATVLRGLKHYSMFFFTRAEQMNRATAFLGAYHRALDRGASLGEAKREAIALNAKVNFDGQAANRPELLRQQWARLPTQFWHFWFSYLGLVMGQFGMVVGDSYRAGKKLVKGDAAGAAGEIRTEEWGAFVRMMVALVVVGGLLALPAMLLPVEKLWEHLTKSRLADIVTRSASDWAVALGLPSWWGQMMARGIPAAAGVDISGRVGMGRQFLPDQPGDFAGPFFGTGIRLNDLASRQAATTADYLAALSPAFNWLKVLEAAANGADLTQIPMGAWRNLGDGQARMTTPFDEAQTDYKPNTGELVRRGLGFQPLSASMSADMRARMFADRERRRRQEDGYLARIVQAVWDDRRSDIPGILQEARAAGVALPPVRVTQKIQEAQQTRLDRQIRNQPRRDRPELRRQQQQIEEAR